MRSRLLILFLAGSVLTRAQAPGSPYAILDNAYRALRERSYDSAIAGFEKAVSLAPDRADIRKDLAYTYLKIGEPEAARDQFAEAMRLDPQDQHVALEFAFLCHETKQQAMARRIFGRIRKTGNATAEQAFQNIDRPLEEGISRWSKALELSPDNFSAHQELARLAEQRDELALAAEHYSAAWKIRPDKRELLLDLGRVWKEMGRKEDSHAALLAASRGAEPRVAEAARELLPSRYPYVYEFQRALALNPENVELRRELAYLFLEMDKRREAENEFGAVLEKEPGDMLSAAQLGFLRLGRKDIQSAMPLLEKAMRSGDPELANRVRAALKMPPALRTRSEQPEALAPDAKALAAESFAAGYLQDALKYLKVAHEDDPLDFSVMLKLGWTLNMFKDDRQAIEWFRLARKSPDAAISEEATKAYRNLRPGLARMRTTAWFFPFYSSRWRSLFSYAQVKTEFRAGSLPLRPYLSTRFIGDTSGISRPVSGAVQPQYLSESSFIFGAGVATSNWKGLMGWAEAGSAVRYVKRNDVGKMVPDYRGGLAFARSFGHNLGPESKGWLFDTNADAVFISRFDNDTIGYSQNRFGYTFPQTGPMQAQLYWNGNLTADVKRQYWANFVEYGPGVKFRFDGMPQSLLFSANALRGQFTVNEGNPSGPKFTDLRVGLWYAFTY